ncbi:hypothetical protein VEE66_45730 (plasmid) [Escherichia coli]|nr:hypothetical protein VEE66_45730 [Escherichia coli]
MHWSGVAVVNAPLTALTLARYAIVLPATVYIAVALFKGDPVDVRWLWKASERLTQIVPRFNTCK